VYLAFKKGVFGTFIKYPKMTKIRKKEPFLGAIFDKKYPFFGIILHIFLYIFPQSFEKDNTSF